MQVGDLDLAAVARLHVGRVDREPVLVERRDQRAQLAGQERATREPVPARAPLPQRTRISDQGQTGAGRYVIVFFVRKKTQQALIVSARGMTDSERKRYEKK